MSALQRAEAVHTWQKLNWPDKYKGVPDRAMLAIYAAKVAEEGGEVAGAAIKLLEERTDVEDLLKEMGDVYITVMGLFAAINEVFGVEYDPREVVGARWENVRHRVTHDARKVNLCECGHADSYHRTGSSFPTRCYICGRNKCAEFALPGTAWEE